MYQDPKIKRDGWTNLWGGVDSGRAANLLNKNQCVFAVNLTLRGGYPETRPPFVTPKLTFENTSTEAWLASHETQGVHYFAPTQGNPLLAAVIGGRLITVDVLDRFRVRDITPSKQTLTTGNFIVPPINASRTVPVADSSDIRVGHTITIGDGTYEVTANNLNILTLTNKTATAGVSIPTGRFVIYPDANPENLPQTWMEQVGDWLVIQDGKSAALRYNGTDVRRSTPTGEVPTGTAMIFNEEIGRLMVALATNEIAVGDILDPIKFTEDTYLNEGGKFRIPKHHGPITGACMLANQDRANGQGAALFFTEERITAFNLPPNRDQWKNLQFNPIITMPIFGATSHYSIVNVNGDVFYRGRDGLRSFALTRQEFAQWGNTPMSAELGRVLDVDDRKLLRFSASCLFDNRLLFTAAPRKGRYGAYHEMLCVLDFDGVSRINRVPPRFDGVWTGIKPQHFVTGNFGGEERCFAFCRSEAGGVQLWEILRKGDFDGDEGRIEWYFESRGLDFRDETELKRLDGFEMWIDKVVGEVNFTLHHKPDASPCWHYWGVKKVCQKHKDCSDDGTTCTNPKTYRPGYRSRLAFGQPPDADENLSDNRPARFGYEHEVRLSGTGRVRVKKCLAKAAVIPEDANPPIETEES